MTLETKIKKSIEFMLGFKKGLNEMPNILASALGSSAEYSLTTMPGAETKGYIFGGLSAGIILMGAFTLPFTGLATQYNDSNTKNVEQNYEIIQQNYETKKN